MKDSTDNTKPRRGPGGRVLPDPAPGTAPPARGFPWKCTWLSKNKVNKLVEGPFLFLVGGEGAGTRAGSLCHPGFGIEQAGKKKKKEKKGASALYCVYILKNNKVLYVFIALIIVIKSLPFFLRCFCFLFFSFSTPTPLLPPCFYFLSSLVFWFFGNSLFVFVLLLVGPGKILKCFKKNRNPGKINPLFHWGRPCPTTSPSGS